MKVKALKSYYLKNKRHEAGETFDIEDRIANVLVARKLAVTVHCDEIVQENKTQTYTDKNITTSNNRMLVAEQEQTPKKDTKKTSKKISNKKLEDDGQEKETKKRGRKKKASE